MLTTYMNVNFNKMLETLTFQQSYAQYLYWIHTHKQIIKSGGSSSEHYSGTVSVRLSGPRLSRFDAQTMPVKFFVFFVLQKL